MTSTTGMTACAACRALVVGCLLLLAGCEKDPATPTAAKASLPPEAKAELDRKKALAARSPALPADGVVASAASVEVDPAAKVLTVHSVVKNGSKEGVHGVNLALTFADDGGLAVGGYSTQQYFSPELAAGAEQPILLQIPLVEGGLERSKTVVVAVVNRIKPGGSPDGWKPLAPPTVKGSP